MLNSSIFSVKLFRRFLCLCLALLFAMCCLIQPLEAQATASALVAAGVGVAAGALVRSVMSACGLLPGSNLDAYDSLADSIADALDTVWDVTSVAGTALLKAYTVANNLYVQKELVQSVLDSLSSSNAIVSSVSYDDSLVYSSAGNVLTSLPYGIEPDALLATMLKRNSVREKWEFNYYYKLYVGDAFAGFLLSTHPHSVDSSGEYFVAVSGTYSSTSEVKSMASQYFLRKVFDEGYNFSERDGIVSNVSLLNLTGVFSYELIDVPTVYSAAEGYTMEQFAPSITAPAYADWMARAVTEAASSGGDDNGPRGLLPITVAGLTASAIAGLTQAAAQAGGAVASGVQVEATGETITLEGVADAPAETVPGEVADTSAAVATGIGAWWSTAVQSISQFFTDVCTIVANTGAEIMTKIEAIPQAIADVLAAIFVPSTDFLTDKVIPFFLSPRRSAACMLVLCPIPRLSASSYNRLRLSPGFGNVPGTAPLF